MTHYGYKIENGKPVVIPEEARTVFAFFKFYSEGKSITEAREVAALPVGTTTAKAMLRRPVYRGDEGYPQIIPVELYNTVQEELMARTHAPTRKKAEPAPVYTKFRFDETRLATAASSPASSSVGKAGGARVGDLLSLLYPCIVPDPHGSEHMTGEERRRILDVMRTAVSTAVR